jgi:hypothetical protein
LSVVELGDRIRLGFERFNRRDWEAIARGLPEHFEAVDHLDERHARGPRAFEEITTANGDLAFEDLRMEPSEIVALPAPGDRVELLVRIFASASGGTSGVPVDSELAQVWTFERGVPVRFEQFRTWDEARRAAGAD